MTKPGRTACFLIVALAVAALGACGESADRADGERVGSDGGDVIDELELTLLFTIAGDDLGVGRIGGILGNERDVWVTDVHAAGQEILRFDETGARVGTIGGPGDGPGEFSGLGPWLAWLGDTLVAADNRLQRLTFFTPEGGLIDTAPYHSDRAAGRSTSWLLGGAGGSPLLLGVRADISRRIVTFDQAPEPLVVELFLRAVDGVEGPRDLPALSQDGMREHQHLSNVSLVTSQVLCMSPARTTMEGFQLPFRDRGPLAARVGRGVGVAGSDPFEFRINVLDLESGEVFSQLERAVEPMPLEDEDWESLPEVQRLRRYEELWRGEPQAMGRPGTPCDVYSARPEHVPILRTLWSDDVGRLWTEWNGPEGLMMTVFDENGDVLAEGPMVDRDGSVPPAVSGDRLYVATRDELDVHGLAVYQWAIAGADR